MNLKRRYFDLRMGFVNSSPFIQAVNFILISYNTVLLMSLDVPFYVYAPLFFVGVLILLSVIGNLFRKIQHDTDLNMIFERRTNEAKILYDIMTAIREGKTNQSFDDSMTYLKKIYEKRL